MQSKSKRGTSCKKLFRIFPLENLKVRELPCVYGRSLEKTQKTRAKVVVFFFLILDATAIVHLLSSLFTLVNFFTNVG